MLPRRDMCVVGEYKEVAVYLGSVMEGCGRAQADHTEEQRVGHLHSVQHSAAQIASSL